MAKGAQNHSFYTIWQTVKNQNHIF